MPGNSNSFFSSENQHSQTEPFQYALCNFIASPLVTISGQLLLSALNQSVFLVSAPPLLILACHAAIAAMMIAPLLYGLSSLIDDYLSENVLTRRLSYIGYYLLTLVLDVELTACLTALSGYQLMTIYTLFAIYGTGLMAVGLAGVGLMVMANALGCFDTTINKEAPETGSNSRFSI